MRLRILFLLLICMIVVGCEPAVAERSPEMAAVLDLAGDAANGEALFNKDSHGSALLPSCVLCHSLEEGTRLAGPSLAGVSGRAATTIEGESAEVYLYNSIIDPNTYIVDSFNGGVMSGQYADALTDQEIADLIAYLQTLK